MWMLALHNWGVVVSPGRALAMKKGTTMKTGLINVAVSVVILALQASAAVGEVRYTITKLETLPGGYATYAYGINNSGQVVGYAATQTAYSASFYSNGSMTHLGILPSQSGIPGSVGVLCLRDQ